MKYGWAKRVERIEKSRRNPGRTASSIGIWGNATEGDLSHILDSVDGMQSLCAMEREVLRKKIIQLELLSDANLGVMDRP